jgi:hypothetical protein
LAALAARKSSAHSIVWRPKKTAVCHTHPLIDLRTEEIAPSPRMTSRPTNTPGGSLDYPALFSMVREVLVAKEVEEVRLTDNQLEGIQFANGMRRYLDNPSNEPPEPGPHRQGFRFAKRITTHIEGEPPVTELEPPRSSTEGMNLSPGESHPGPAEEEAERRRLGE